MVTSQTLSFQVISGNYYCSEDGFVSQLLRNIQNNWLLQKYSGHCQAGKWILELEVKKSLFRNIFGGSAVVK